MEPVFPAEQGLVLCIPRPSYPTKKQPGQNTVIQRSMGKAVNQDCPQPPGLVSLSRKAGEGWGEGSYFLL